MKLTREQQRSTFRECNIHIKNDLVSKNDPVLDLTDPSSEQWLSDNVDLLYPRDAHGTSLVSYVFLSLADFHLYWMNRQSLRDGS